MESGCDKNKDFSEEITKIGDARDSFDEAYEFGVKYLKDQEKAAKAANTPK